LISYEGTADERFRGFLITGALGGRAMENPVMETVSVTAPLIIAILKTRGGSAPRALQPYWTPLPFAKGCTLLSLPLPADCDMHCGEPRRIKSPTPEPNMAAANSSSRTDNNSPALNSKVKVALPTSGCHPAVAKKSGAASKRGTIQFS